MINDFEERVIFDPDIFSCHECGAGTHDAFHVAVVGGFNVEDLWFFDSQSLQFSLNCFGVAKTEITRYDLSFIGCYFLKEIDVKHG